MYLKNKNILFLIFLVSVLFLAFFVRAWNIENVPAGVYPDEAVNGIDAYKVMHGLQPFQWFYPDNQGREGLFMNLIVISFSLFDVSIFGLKFWSILFGTLTVLGTYFLTKELTRSRKAGLVAAFLVATSFWAINFSRISFRANMLPFILVWSSYFLFLGLRLKKYWPFLVGGLIFGIGLHTYIAFRIAPIFLFALFLAAWASRTKFLQTYWRHTLLFIVGFFITASPMLWTFWQHPEYIGSRSSSISVFSPEVHQGQPLLTLAKSVGLTLQQYNIVGDMNWRHNYPPYPLLYPFTGIAFLIGLVILIKNFFSSLWLRITQKKYDRHLEISTFLLAWLVVMHAPSFLTFEGMPHALRSIGALPAVYIIATIPFAWLLNVYARKNAWNRLGAYLFVGALLLSAGTFNIIKYHIFWANAPEQHRAFQSNLLDISKHLHTLPSDTPIYLIMGNMERIPIRLFHTERAFESNTLFTLSSEEALQTNFQRNSFLFFSERPNDALQIHLQNTFESIDFQEYQKRKSDPYFVIHLK